MKKKSSRRTDASKGHRKRSLRTYSAAQRETIRAIRETIEDPRPDIPFAKAAMHLRARWG